MDMLDDTGEFDATVDDMARAKKARKQVDLVLVDSYVQRLKAAGVDKALFDSVVAQIQSDANASALELVEIAQKFAIPGRRPTSSAAAMAAISKRFVELVRFHKKNAVAAKVRPW